MKQFKEWIYFNFADVCGIIANNDSLGYEDVFDLENMIPAVYPNLSDSQIVDKFKNIFYLSSGDLAFSDEVNQVFIDVYNRYFGEYCFRVEAERFNDGALLLHEAYLFMNSVFNMANFTAPRFLMMLEIYKNQSTHLLDKVQTITSAIAKFNDTPQGSGDYSTDTHTTNLNKSEVESTTDVAPLMERIDQIQQSYDNLMLKWTNEFDRLFIRKENIE